MAIHIRLNHAPALPTIRTLRAAQYFFFLIGMLALGYCVYAWLDSKLYQDHWSQTFQEMKLVTPEPAASRPIDDRVTGINKIPAAEPVTADPSSPVEMNFKGAPLGQIEISSIGLKAMVAEGIDSRTLRRAVGHIPGTGLPGESGNVGIAGHRDTFFRGLSNVHRNDVITLTTSSGSFRYVVDYIELVRPENVSVIADTDEPILTLVTCYPFYYVGPSPKRFIVRAHLSR